MIEKPMKITPIEKYSSGLTPLDGMARCKAKKLGMITNAEADELLNREDEQYKQFEDYLPFWTATHIEYKAGATEAIVYNDGEKPTTIGFPLQDGWYECDNQWSIPNGAPSNSSNPKARYLWRWQDRDYVGFVRRRDWDWFVDVRRYVNCVEFASNRFGVLAIQRKPCKHKYKIIKTKVCINCNQEKGWHIVLLFFQP